VVKQDLPSGRARKEVLGIMLARDLIDFSNRIENDWIDPVMPDF